MLRRSLNRFASHDTGGVTEIIERWNRPRFYKATATMAAVSSGLLATQCFTLGVPVAAFTAAFAYRGYKDINQTTHTILSNFPVLGHVRYIFEGVRGEIQQYFIEDDTSGAPFSRAQRSIIYQRAKGQIDTVPFGSKLDAYDEGYMFLTHSNFPQPKLDPSEARVMFGESTNCRHPYSASIYNISAMSYGALSSVAVTSLNGGAKIAGCFHNTGEGGLAEEYHVKPGGDVVMQLGTAYFGCRNPETGAFDMDKYKEKMLHENIKMTEIKLQQSAKPSKGGILPAAKITREVSDIRGVMMGVDCVSPARHTAFTTPKELVEFAASLREASGKPVGIKICVGDPIELAMLVRTMAETKLYLDFITVDGDGGTGAAPPEFLDRMGTPLLDSIYMVHNLLRGAGIRQHVRVIAAGKIVSGFSLFRALHIGADTCNTARGFMFALGCIQSLRCNRGNCPTGIATAEPTLTAGFDITDKRRRVANFHKNTVSSALDIVAACGFSSLTEVRARPVLMVRRVPYTVQFFNELYPKLKDSELIQIEEEATASGTCKARLEASMQNMSFKDRLVRAWLISGDPDLMPKIRLYQERKPERAGGGDGDGAASGAKKTKKKVAQ